MPVKGKLYLSGKEISVLKKLNGKAIVLITAIITLIPLCFVSYNYNQYNWNGKLIYVPAAIAGILAMIFV